MGTVLFALIAGYWLMRAWNAAVEQAGAEVRRYREEFTTFRKDVRETVDRGTRAGMSAAGAAQAAWRAMKGAPRGACDRARKIAEDTGPVRRVVRAAREAGKMGAASVRQAAASSHEARRSASRSSTGPGRQAGGSRRPRMPKIGVCGDCGLPALLTALSRSPVNGRNVCRQCLADTAVPPRAAAPQPSAAPAPAGPVWDAEIVPEPTLPAPAPAKAAVAPRPVPAAALPGPVPAPQAPSFSGHAVWAPPAAPARTAEPLTTTAAPGPAPVPATAAAPAAAPAGGTAPAITKGELVMAGNSLVPANGAVPLPAGGASGGEAGNHGQFVYSSAGLRADAETLMEQQRAMLSRLHAVNGRGQVQDILAWADQARVFAQAVTAMVSAVDPGEQNLISTIANAGGPREIPNMSYFGEQ